MFKMLQLAANAISKCCIFTSYRHLRLINRSPVYFQGLGVYLNKEVLMQFPLCFVAYFLNELLTNSFVRAFLRHIVTLYYVTLSG